MLVAHLGTTRARPNQSIRKPLCSFVYIVLCCCFDLLCNGGPRLLTHWLGFSFSLLFFFLLSLLLFLPFLPTFHFLFHRSLSSFLSLALTTHPYFCENIPYYLFSSLLYNCLCGWAVRCLKAGVRHKAPHSHPYLSPKNPSNTI